MYDQHFLENRLRSPQSRRIGFILFSLVFANSFGQKDKNVFSFYEISDIPFREAYSSNYNAVLEKSINDSLKIENAFKAIEKTYTDEEKELAGHELCETPRCLTSYEGFYTNLNLHLFLTQDYHYENASFVFDDTVKLASGYQKFRGTFGVMSKEGLWAGLERHGSDSYLKIEICKASEKGIWSIYRFDFAGTDINNDNQEKDIPVMFWADKRTLMISCEEYEKGNRNIILKYYALEIKL